MFGLIFRRAQATVDTVIGQTVNRALVALPFIVALGFAVAALALRMYREFGAETANLILAAFFGSLGLIMFLFLNIEEGRTASAASPDADARSSAETAAGEQTRPDLAAADRELLLTALTTAAPVALPALIRSLTRNFGLVAIVALAFFILSRSPETPEDPVTEAELKAAA